VAERRLAPDPKKVEADHAHLVLIDESGLFLNPLVRRSWALKGKTPVVGGDGGHRRKVSVIGAVSVSPVAHRLGLYFSTLPDGYFTAASVTDFLRDLLGHLRGKVVVVWDGGGNHKGPATREFLRRNKRLTLERLPAYAPDLNPVEAVWSWLKYGQLANFVPDDIPGLDDEVMDRLIELKFDPDLLRALWDGSDLPFPTKIIHTQGSIPAIQ
jgi:putative transposase